MKTYLINNKELTLSDKNLPILRPQEVLIELKAWSLNYRDLMALNGTYGINKSDLVPLSDGAGVVVDCGKDVTRFKNGDRVMPIFMPDWIEGKLDLNYAKTALGNAVDGVLSEFISANEECLVKIPDHLNFEQAACLPCAGVTAFNALFVAANLKPNSKLLLIGTGGVSIFGLQFASAIGAESFIVSSSNEKLKIAAKLGAKHLINYKETPAWSKTIWQLTQEKGVDLVLETGGSATFNHSLASAGAGATISSVGILSGRECQIDLVNIFRRGLTIKGIFVGSREIFEELNKFITQNKITPIIDRSFNFLDATAAFNYFSEQKHFGKVVITK